MCREPLFGTGTHVAECVCMQAGGVPGRGLRSRSPLRAVRFPTVAALMVRVRVRKGEHHLGP